MLTKNNIGSWLLGLALVLVLCFQQLEIATIHEDVQDIKAYINSRPRKN